MLTSRKTLDWLKHNFSDLLFVTLIVGVGVLLAFKNYIPGTWLLGWDNLVPELNLKLNIARSLSSVWQEYQGLGLLGGMAHAADLPRQLILAIFSLVFPVDLLRYLWTFAMLILGPLGIYFLIRIEKRFVASLAAFSGAMFYLFNLATVQTFFTPFETFISFYGFFPWLIFSAQSYLRHGGRGRLLGFAFISLLATSAFYVQTLFIVYAIFLFFFAIETIARIKKSGLARSFKLGFVTILVNSFWLLPAIYFTVVSPGIPGNSHINSIATPETQIMNVARGGAIDVATLKGYWFDYFDLNEEGKYGYLYQDWIPHSSKTPVVNLSLGLFFVAALGTILGLTKKKGIKYSYLLLLPLAFVVMSGVKIPGEILTEAFRNVFTKWATATSLLYSAGIGSFIYAIASVSKRKIGVTLGVLAAICTITASVYVTGPVFQGHLIAKSMRVNLPSDYLNAIDYFKGQDSTKRIADFPITDFWGWRLNDWGYRGSGFLWYGVPQPILSRTFDVWSSDNEVFYNEISHAVVAEDPEDLRYLVNKYQVGFIIFDESIFRPGDPNFAADIQKQKAFLESLDFVGKERVFGKITVYKIEAGDITSFLSAPRLNYESPYVKLGQTGSVFLREDFSGSQGYAEAKNCGLMGLGSVTREKKDGGNYYKAENDGVSCDYFYYPSLDTSKAYLMRIKGKNVSGRSLKVYMYDVDGQKVVLEELLPSGSFDKTYPILPFTTKGASKGYTLNVETRAFGKIKSENIINAIEFYSVGFSYAGPVPIDNNLRVESVRRYGTWLYKVDIQGGGLIQLGEGYNEGWVAFELPKFEEFKHLKFNGWSNAWVIPSAPDTQSSIIYIAYWPQLLEWGGMVLGIVLTYIIFRLY